MTASLVVGAISPKATHIAANCLSALLGGLRCGDVVRELAPECVAPAAAVAGAAPRNMSLLNFTSLLETAAQESGRSHLGLEMAEGALPQRQGIVSDLFVYAPTVGQALQDLVRFFPVIQTGTAVRLERRGDLAHFVYAVETPSVSGQLQDAAYTLGKVWGALRRATGEAWSLDGVAMAQRAPASTQVYTRFFRAPVHFDARVTALCFKAADLDMPIVSADSARYAAFCETLSKALPVREDPSLLEDALRAWLRDVPQRWEATLSDAAGDFGLTPRTLQRRLSDIGLNFIEMRAQMRMDLARRMLVEDRSSMRDIAAHLGFSEPSAFTRAFRLHTRQSPRAYRQAFAPAG